MICTMKLVWLLPLVDLAFAAKVRPLAANLSLELLVQDPGLASNNTHHWSLGDKEALALLNATSNRTQMRRLEETSEEEEEEYDYPSGHDMDEFDDPLDDAEDSSFALEQSFGNASLNASEESEWWCRGNCRKCKRWNRRACTACHRDFKLHRSKCHDRRCGGNCKSCPAFNQRKSKNHCNSCHAGYVLVGRDCKNSHRVNSGWSKRGDDKQAHAWCPKGMYVKKCWGGFKGDGNFVDKEGRRCVSQATGGMRVKAHADCWTTKTVPEVPSGWKRNDIKTTCSTGDAIGCTCYSAWRVKNKCYDSNHKNSADFFAPTNGECKRWTPNHASRVFALCSHAPCGDFNCGGGADRIHNAIGSTFGKCCKCKSGFIKVGDACKTEHRVDSGWSHWGDDKRAHVWCPEGMYVKKCWGGFDGDGNFVDKGGRRCTSQSTGGKRVRAHADCWTTKTVPEVPSGWKRNHITTKCKTGDAIQCTCYSAWRVKNKCYAPNKKNSADHFAPTNGECKRWTPNHNSQVYALCSHAPCGNFNCGSGADPMPHAIGSTFGKCCKCKAGKVRVGNDCKTDHHVASGWSAWGDDKRAEAWCPEGMYAKKCWGGFNGDGNFVDKGGRRCVSQSTGGTRVRAFVDCWTTKTEPQGTHGWKKNHIAVRCKSGDAIGCTCYSAWRVKNKCYASNRKNSADFFTPTNGECKRWTPNHNSKVYALCSQAPCGDFACPAGYTKKDRNTIGSSAAKCCTPVSCPAHSSGTDVPSGCSCHTGRKGDIKASTHHPYYTGSCDAAPCPWWTSGTDVLAGCSCWSGYFGSITAKQGKPYYSGGCKSALVGGTFAFHNAKHNRFIKLDKHDMKRSPGKAADKLPDGWGAERFVVKEGGEGRVGFYSPGRKQYWQMHKSDMSKAGHMGSWELFRVVDAGAGVFAFHNSKHNRFVRMNKKTMDTSGKKGATSLPGGWSWERFKIVQAVPGFRPGTIIGLFNHDRYVKMTNSWTLSGGSSTADNLPEDGQYQVVDAGMGQIALYNPAMKSYIQLSSKWEIGRRTDLTDEARFTIVDLGSGKIGLHNAKRNRFFGFFKNGKVGRSPVKDGDEMPSNWDAERLTALQIIKCSTGGGSKCKTCLAMKDRKKEDECASCNDGYYLDKGQCKAASCPWWADGKNVPSGCTCWNGYFGDLKATSSKPYYEGTCKSALVGGTFAFHNAKQNRFIKVGKNDMERSPTKAADDLPAGWGSEKFVVKEGGEGRVGFYNSGRKQYWMMHHADMRRIGHMGSWEKFRLVDAGAGNVALHNEKHNRFVRMSKKTMDTSGKKGAKDLPGGWTWEGFKVVQAIPNLDLGTIIALHCGQNNRFVQMIHNRMQGHSDKLDDFNPGWYSVPLKVVDGGNGQLAFYNERAKKYVSMTGTDVSPSSTLDDQAKFTAVDMGSGKIALHNAKYNRFLAMRSSGNMERSGVKDGDDIPSSGWEEAVFTVLKSFNCKTGSGELCKSCPVPSQREKHNECTSCNAGYYLDGTTCKAYDCDNKKCATCVDQAQRKAHNHCSTCHGGSVIVGRECKSEHVVKSGWSATRDDRRATAECPAGMWLKKCEIERTQNWDWGDGAFVDEDAKKCTVQTGAAKQKLKAKATCSTTQTYGMHSAGGMKGGKRQTDCPKPISCMCHTHWEVRRNCDKKQAVFSPSGGTCQRSSKSKKQVNAICEIAPCSTGSGSKCRSCKDIRDRKADHHCDSCNPGYYISGTGCQAYACNSPCATCVAQNFRKKDNQCASCDSGHTLVGDQCKAYACNTGGGSKCKSCVEVSKRQRDDQCATCNSGYFLEDGECKPYNCNTDVCKSCAKQSEQKGHAHCASCHEGTALVGSECKSEHTVTSGWSQAKDDRRATATCPKGMWLKNCEILRNQNWDWGDGVFVDDDATSCTVQTGAARKKLRAKASCSTTRTYGLKSEGGMKKGATQTHCAKPLACMCHSHWEARKSCDGKKSLFSPSNGICKRKSNGKKQVNAICEIAPCSTGSGSKCRTCMNYRFRTAENHCASCNPGYYLDGTVCKAYKCGSSCKTCVAQEQRVVQFESTKGKKCKNTPFTFNSGVGCDGWSRLTEAECTQKCLDSEQAKNCPQKPCAALAFYKSSGWCHLYEKCDGFESDKHATALLPQETDFCATCNGGFFLEDGICKPYTCDTDKCGSCVDQKDRTQHNHCKTCNGGYFLSGKKCKAYGCIKGTGDKCKTCVVQGKRKEDSHCAACNDGFYLHSRDCEAFTCKEGKNRLCESCRPQDERKMDGHCSSCNFGYVLKGDVCQSVMVGSVIAIHNAEWNRYVKMTSNDLTLSPKKGADEFPAGWSAEKFLVIDAGKGRVALKNTRQNKVISIQSTGDLVPADLPVPQCVDGKFGLNFCSQWCNHEGFWGCGISKLIGKDGRNTDNQDYTCDCSGCSGCAESPSSWVPVWTGKNGEVAFHSPSGSAWMMMTEDNMWGKTSYTAEQIMGSWTRYKVVQPHPLLADGSIIALHCGKHKKFLSMGNSDMSSTKVKGKNNFPDSWLSAKFRVVDAGFGQIALYSDKHQRFIRLHGKDLKRSSKQADKKLPGDWADERFTVVYADGKLAFHNPTFNRFLRMNKNGADTSSVRNAEDLPDGWSWERFELVNAKFTCATGDGSSCKTCKNPNDRTVDDHCASCNDGWKLVGTSCEAVPCPADSTGSSVGSGCSCNAGFSGTIEPTGDSPFFKGSCSAVACPSWTDGKNVPSGCACWKGYFGSLQATSSQPYYTGSCKSALVGGTFALHNDANNRFAKMVSNDMSRSPKKKAESLPDGWSSERFQVVEGDAGRVGLKSIKYNKYVCMDHSNMKNVGHLKNWEKFRVWDAGDGSVAFHNSNHNRFIRLGDRALDTSGKKNVRDLPSGWSWERFEVVQAVPGLPTGSTIALNCHKRFLQMSGQQQLDGRSAAVDQLADDWESVRFEVVDAGHGQIALFNTNLKSFVEMTGKDVLRSEETSKTGVSDEARFTVVDMGSGKIALHNAKYNRFVGMRASGEVVRSQEKDGDELPSTWTDAIFKVVQAYKCQTGSGQMCKSCVAPGKREAENHCDSCYAGYALVGRTCKDEHVVTSEKSAKADDKRAAAQCPEGMWLKKCEMKKGGNDWGDGAFVDDASTTCTVQTGTTRQPVIAKATCSTTKTYGMKSQTGWARGNLKVPCPKAIACTCYSAWTVNGECGNVAVFNPENGICSGSGGKRQLNAICEIVSCSTGLGDKCKTCKDVRDRQAEDHCDSCNPGYYISGTSCKAYSCEKGSGSACKTCVAQAKRTADDQCASCNPGWALVGTVCKKEHKVTSSWSKRGDDKRTSVDCPAGMWVKKCWGGFDGDGNWVSNNGKTCNSQATGGMRVKAHADCWTTETLPEVSGRHWKKGRITVDCKVGDAIGCTCYSAWRVKNKCFAANGKNSEASFAPVDHKCTRSTGGHRVKVFALCSQEKCASYECPEGYDPKPASTIGSSTDSCCSVVTCPAGSAGEGVHSGCTCQAGYTGSIEKSGTAPFFKGSCDAVQCPKNSHGTSVVDGCTCDTGYSGEIKASTESPFFTGKCKKTCALYTCPKGWKPKADSVVGASRKACCELVKCPSGSSGESVVDGCSCKAGFSGTISASSASPYYTGSCSSVQCPSHSEGANVPKGCSCKAGYKGSIEASTTDPFYTGECSAVACPANSAGTDVPSGCACLAGFSGLVAASSKKPFFTGGCASVDCPAHSEGKDVASGCSCLPGFAGSIGATTASPFFVGECTAVACPVHSTGTDVPSGCKCKDGYKGTIKATTAEPFYKGVCTPVACPANSAGNNVPGGCECLAGFSGSITGDDTKPWYEGSCTAVSCPKGSSGTDLPTGCTCKAGFSGSVTATKKTPYFSGGCDAVSCPDNSEGKNVPRGCSCKTGYTGTITATSSSPFFSGKCKATCSLFTCPQGWKPKPGDTIGDTQELCCETVACPGNSAGASVSAGCSCDAGFSGAVTPSSKSPFYENGCTAVQCPVHSTGKTVPSGCSCNAGYSGSITASSQTPFFAGSCEAVACPDHSSGADVPSGCKCHAGFSGAVQATTTAPFFTSTCKAVACPANSVGTDVANGCQCQAGYSGSIEASQKAPFYTGSCDAVACPKNAKGTDVPSGCTCKDGFSGSVSASTAAPYYTTTCTPVECPENSAGQNVPKGCICNAGYTGIIAAAPQGFTGKCSPAACPDHSSGTDLVSGCTCNPGYFGTVTAKIGSPFFDGGCQAWSCAPGSGTQCQSCVEQAKRTQAEHCGSCNVGYYIDEPSCKAMTADQKCGGPTCAKNCHGEKCGFKCAGSLFGQEECARACDGASCGYQCTGGNCASSCKGDKCAYECTGGKDVQQCGMGCVGMECAYYCQGTECAKQCDGDRCGSYCSGESGSEGHCAFACKGRQCGFECIGTMCAAQCSGERCAYRCQGSHEDVGSCGTKCQGTECAYRCEGSSCAELCQGERCGYGCASGNGASQTCAKGCHGEECGAQCEGAACAASCQGPKCAYECSGQLGDLQTCGLECVGTMCAAKCQGAECAKGCQGDFCGKECSGSTGDKSHCAAGCVGRRCAAKCKGAYCAAGCEGVGCANGCEGDHCDQGCKGDHCSKGAAPASTCEEALAANPGLCGLKSSYKDEVLFAGEDAKDVCCSKTDCPDGYELVDGSCEKPKCKGTLVQGCYLSSYSECESTYIKYETEYIQCGVSGPNCLSNAVCIFDG